MTSTATPEPGPRPRCDRRWPAIDIDLDGVETNIVFFRVRPPWSADAFVTGLLDRGIRMSTMGDRIRAVTHLDVDGAGIDRALAAAELVLREA